MSNGPVQPIVDQLNELADRLDHGCFHDPPGGPECCAARADAQLVRVAIETIEGLGLSLGRTLLRVLEPSEPVAEINRLRELLVEANLAFDDCTGDYAQKLVIEDEWRSFHPDYEELRQEAEGWSDDEP